MCIRDSRTALGIELGSTRIKAVLIDESRTPLASGGFGWENRCEDGVWTYHLDDVWAGLQSCFAELSAQVREEYGVSLTRIGALGISAMMHGYLAFDEQGNQLTPFRTWRNTMTEQAAAELTELFQFNIPQRWSIAHLYQAMLNGEEPVSYTHLDVYKRQALPHGYGLHHRSGRLSAYRRGAVQRLQTYQPGSMRRLVMAGGKFR